MDSYIISGVATYRRSFWLVSGIQSVQNGSYKGTKDKLDLKKTAFYGNIIVKKYFMEEVLWKNSVLGG